MQIKRIRVLTKIGQKELILLGEYHIYGKADSVEAKKLLDQNKFDRLFVEGVDMGFPEKYFYSAFFKMAKIVTRKNHESMVELARKENILTIGLEEGRKLPLQTRIFLTIFMILIFLVPLHLIKSLLDKKWTYSALLVIVIGDSILIQKRLAKKLSSDLIGRYLPTDKEKRDLIMSSALNSYLEQVRFKKGLVVIGEAHIDKIVDSLQKKFKTEQL
ncbi:MAG: hypothetical protein ACXADW_20760 [Candidatus Hodarchaeales archaeon]|jgi:hypothetical protein